MKLVNWMRDLQWSRVTLCFVFVVIAAIAISVLCCWDWLSQGGPNSSTIRNIVLAAAAVIALPLAIWRSTVAERQADTAQGSQFNERYQRGAEMIGSDVLTVRLGGIYALERLAQEHDVHHVPIMRLFCAFVCNPPEAKDDKSAATSEGDDHYVSTRPDVVAIMEAIATRKAEHVTLEPGNRYQLDFRNANLGGLDLFHIDNVDLSWSKLTGANLSYIRLRPQTNFSSVRDAYGANLSKARLNRVNFESSNLSEADLSNSSLVGANLQCAELKNANLANTTLANADLSGATFREANLSGTRFSLNDTPPAHGLTQEQLDAAFADIDNPPNLNGVIDEITRQPLVWRGRSPGGEGP